MRKRVYVIVAALVAVGLAVSWTACKKKEVAPTAVTAGTAATAAPTAEKPLALSAEAQTLPKGTKVAVMELEKGGVVEISLLEKDAPKTVANFVELVNGKLYDNLPIHRVEGFVVQTGDDEKAEQIHPGIKLEVEKDTRKCVRGAVSMARSMPPGAKTYGDTSPSEFFILKKDSPHLDKDFCVFGGVVGKGMDVVDNIVVNDVIKRIRILTVGEEAAPPATK
jgi:peptidyl-prolyl cis-trans isomerase B (cyclophilin B)